MKILNKAFLYSSFFILGNCATHGNFVTDHKDIWYQDNDKGLFYCRANVKDNGSADPSCFEAGFQIYNGEKSLSKKNKN